MRNPWVLVYLTVEGITDQFSISLGSPARAGMMPKAGRRSVLPRAVLDPDGREVSANERSYKGLAFLFYEGYIEVVPRSAASPVRSGSTAVLAGELMGNHCRLIPEMIE